MATKVTHISFSGNARDVEKVLSAGKYFSGSIRENSNINSWIEFHLVEKDKMTYILNDLKLEEEVRFEIRAYDEYPEDVQRPSDWDKLKSI